MSKRFLTALASVIVIASANAEFRNPPGCPQPKNPSKDTAGQKDGVMTLLECPRKPDSRTKQAYKEYERSLREKSEPRNDKKADEKSKEGSTAK